MRADLTPFVFPPVPLERTWWLFIPAVEVSAMLACAQFCGSDNGAMAASDPVLLLAGPAAKPFCRVAGASAHTPDPALLRKLINAPLLEVARQLSSCRGYLGTIRRDPSRRPAWGADVVLFGPSDPAIWSPRD